ncbi:MAG TPA: head GIN domain-containing protein [Arenibacter sp.]|nr:head GIN domain-containing protein [Arenibacter sp.]
MTTLARITIALILAILFSSCGFDIDFGSGKKGNGIVQKENRTVTGDFNAVSASEGLNVYITQGGEFKILVEADENVIDLIATDQKNGSLRIHSIENIANATKNIYVTLPKVTALEASSGANLISQNTIRTETIDLNASSGAKLEITELRAEKINADSSSGADIRIGGETKALLSKASSGSGIRANDLIANECRADASSGARISVNVTGSLVAEASSGGNIQYTGTAKVEKNNSIAGSINQF